jgi:hypothetical protein
MGMDGGIEKGKAKMEKRAAGNGIEEVNNWDQGNVPGKLVDKKSRGGPADRGSGRRTISTRETSLHS